MGLPLSHAPGYAKSLGSRRFGARYIEPPDGDGLRSGHRRVLSALYVDFVCQWEAFPSKIFEQSQLKSVSGGRGGGGTVTGYVDT